MMLNHTAPAMARMSGLFASSVATKSAALMIDSSDSLASATGEQTSTPGFFVMTSVALALPRRLLSSAYLSRQAGGRVERHSEVAGSGGRRGPRSLDLGGRVELREDDRRVLGEHLARDLLALVALLKLLPQRQDHLLLIGDALAAALEGDALGKLERQPALDKLLARRIERQRRRRAAARDGAGRERARRAEGGGARERHDDG